MRKESIHAKELFIELAESGYYNIDDRARNSAEDYSATKEERDTDAVRRFVDSEAFAVVAGLGAE